MQKFTHNFSTLHYKISGSGKPVLFLHGFLEDHSIWDEIYPVFVDAGFRIILVDLPCHGLSRFDGDNCSMSQMAEIIHAFLSGKNISEPFVFGHSMGGYVGLELLRLRSIKLTLLHSNFWEDSAEKKKDRNRVIDVVKKNKNFFLSEAIPNLFAPENRKKCESIISSLIQKATQIPTSEIIAATAGIRDRKAAYDLLNKNKVNIIQGAADPIVPAELMKSELEKLEKIPEIMLIENSGHMSMWEQPERLINILKSTVID